jgi:small subunit ribosomal protein S18
MARNNDRDRGSKRVPRDSRPGSSTKVCVFCKDQAAWVDYKDISGLRRFMSDRGRIRSRRVTGNCAQHQREVQVAVKTAREIALLPYVQRTASDRGPGPGPRRGGYSDELTGAKPATTDVHVDVVQGHGIGVTAGADVLEGSVA